MRPPVGMLGLSSGLGQRKAGLESAPDWIRVNCLTQSLCRPHLIHDYGNLYPVSPHLSASSMDDFLQRAFQLSLGALEKHEMLLAFGGDHSVAISTVAASLSLNSSTKVIWIDAHGDLNTPQTSKSKNIHGMPLAALLGQFQSSLEISNCLRPENLLILGVRDLEASELELIERLNLHTISTNEIQNDVSSVTQRVQNWLGQSSEVHISFDVDVLDPFYASATGTPVQNGLDLDSCLHILRAIDQSSVVRSFDFVELNPALILDESEREKTKAMVARILGSILSQHDSTQVQDFMTKVD